MAQHASGRAPSGQLIAEAAEAFGQAIEFAAVCGSERTIRQASEDIADFLLRPYLQEHPGKQWHRSELAEHFFLTEYVVSLAFRWLGERGPLYVEEIDPLSGELTGRLVEFACAHREGIWHPSVLVLVFDTSGNIALQVRGEPDSRGRQDISVAGHRGVGESDVTAALREVREEIGLHITPDRLVLVGEPLQFIKEGLPLVSEETSRPETERTLSLRVWYRGSGQLRAI